MLTSRRTLCLFAELSIGSPEKDLYAATCLGRQYRLLFSHPPVEGINRPADALTQVRLAAYAPHRVANYSPSGEWNLFHGELITFPDHVRDLSPIDRLEGCRARLESFYQRELIWA